MKRKLAGIDGGRHHREFLKTSATLGAAYFVPASVLGANAPSNRINVGIIGTGTRGTPDMQVFMRNDDVQVVAISDVNRASYGYRDETKLMGREPALAIANQYYADKTRSGRFKYTQASAGPHSPRADGEQGCTAKNVTVIYPRSCQSPSTRADGCHD